MLVLNALVRKSSDLLEFNQIHNAATFSSKQLRFHPSTFLPIHCCEFLFNLKYIFVSLCKYSTTLRMNLLTWCRVVSVVGSGLSLSKYSGLNSGLHTKLFYRIRSKDFFFRDADLLCSPR